MRGAEHGQLSVLPHGRKHRDGRRSTADDRGDTERLQNKAKEHSRDSLFLYVAGDYRNIFPHCSCHGRLQNPPENAKADLFASHALGLVPTRLRILVVSHAQAGLSGDRDPVLGYVVISRFVLSTVVHLLKHVKFKIHALKTGEKLKCM